MQMQDIFRTLTKLNHKQDIYLLMKILQYPGDQLNKQWWPPPLIIQKYLRCMKLVKNVFGRTKHISPKFFYTHELQKDGEIDVQQIRSNDNLADLFTKALPSTTFKKLVQQKIFKLKS